MRGPEHFTGVVLAGGAGSRMGGRNKALVTHNGQPLYRYAVDNLNVQCSELVINANRNAEDFTHAGFKVVGDGQFAGLGPLAGVRAGLAHACTPFVAFAACDQLRLPSEVYASLCDAVTSDCGAYACGHKDQVPTCAVLPTSALAEVEARLTNRQLALIPFIQKVARAVRFEGVEFGNLNFQHQVRPE